MIKLMQGDCLEVMKGIPDGSIDLILCDLPYGTTACKWDTVIPFEPLWAQYKRVIKGNGAIVLFGSEPFSSALRMSNIKQYKYDWVWDKITGRGHLVAKIRPMAQHENIIVFGQGKIQYNPQMILMDKPQRGKSMESSRTSIMGGKTTGKSEAIIRTHKYPKTIITQGVDGKYVHPTQKPVALLEYLIKTYTNEGETVLDNCMGSGSTGVACVNTGRNFIGIELDEGYFKIATDRINGAGAQVKLL
ncbi:MAG: site-specific DNA-methyltransferase [Candidatus Micrarchaeia archaeon]